MNKLILAVCTISLALSAVNTVILVQISTKIKEAVNKLEPVAQSVEEMQPVLKELAKPKLPPTPPVPLPPGPFPKE